MSDYPTFARLRAWFEDLDGADYVTRDEVKRFIKAEQANAEAADDLAKLADTLVFQALMQAANGHRGSQRHTARAAAERAATRQSVVTAAENLAAGRPSGLLHVSHKVSDDGTQREAAQMDGSDHHYVAARYDDRSKRNGMFAAFHRAVAKKCGHRRTDEVFTAEQYESLYSSITGAHQKRRTDAA